MDITAFKSHKLGLLLASLVFLSTVVSGRKLGVSSTTAAPEAVTNSKEQDTFYFDPAPINQDVVEGDTVLLQCDVSNQRHIQFFWESDNRQLANTSRRFQDHSDLRILRVDREHDGGAFRCTATNVTTGVSLRSREARLNILWLDKVARAELKQPRESNLEAGVDITIKCEVGGNLSPSIEWFKNRNRLFTNEKYRYLKNAKLKVVSVTAEDNGVYSCSAQNLAGKVDSRNNFLLNIPGEPGVAHLNTETFTKYTLAKQGDSTYLHCQYTGALMTEWYHAEVRLGNTSNQKYQISDNGTLSIRDVSMSDGGGYQCVGVSAQGPEQVFVSELQIAYLADLTDESFQPRRDPQMRPLVVPEDKKLEVLCILPDGLPTPTQRWENAWGTVLPTTGRIKAEDGVLTITNARQEEGGNYTCVVNNTAGEKRRNVWVMVSVPPTWRKPPLSERVTEGRIAMFSCEYVGAPYPVTTITWRKGDFPIDLTHPRYHVDQVQMTLTIDDVHLMDEDNYVCVVNTTGHPLQVSSNAHLYVEKRLKFKPIPVDKKLELNSKSKVPCRADAMSEPMVRWTKEGSVSFPDHISDQDGTLVFDGVKYEDVGNYSCLAYTDAERINVTINIGVVVKPYFVVQPKNTTAYEGHTTILHCVADGNPPPKVDWDKNNILNGYNKDRFQVLANGSLYASEVLMEDVGRYGCTAGNNGGFHREEVYLHVHVARVEGNMMKTIIIAVCSAVAYLAIVIGLTVYCSLRMMRAKNLRKRLEANAVTSDKAENGAVPTEHTELMDKKDRDSSIVKSDMDARSHVSGLSSQPSHSSHSHNSHGSRRRSIDRLAFPRHQLQTLGMLGKGQYGDVFLAKAHMIREGEAETLVVIKSLLSREEAHQHDFRREIDMFSKMNHDYVAKLLGVCCDMEPRFLITEYSDWGDLKQYLWATRKDNGRRLRPLTIAQKTTMCSQVVQGMDHLANNRFVHKDLAARNILLSSTMDLKITNLGLCRDVYATEYFPLHQQLLPLRWLPPESVLEEDFSNKTDVWAFGVFVWEVFTLGDLPYRANGDEEVLKALKVGSPCTLDQPPDCPPELYQIVIKCMNDSPKLRPTFSELVTAIGNIHVDSDV